MFVVVLTSLTVSVLELFDELLLSWPTNVLMRFRGLCGNVWWPLPTAVLGLSENSALLISALGPAEVSTLLYRSVGLAAGLPSVDAGVVRWRASVGDGRSEQRKTYRKNREWQVVIPWLHILYTMN